MKRLLTLAAGIIICMSSPICAEEIHYTVTEQNYDRMIGYLEKEEKIVFGVRYSNPKSKADYDYTIKHIGQHQRELESVYNQLGALAKTKKCPQFPELKTECNNIQETQKQVGKKKSEAKIALDTFKRLYDKKVW